VNELRGDGIYPVANKKLSSPGAALVGKARRGGHFALARHLLLSCSKPMGQKRILVVDDEDVLRELLADILAREGHQVDTACDGLEALDWLDQHHYDAVFTDLRMPGLDGPKLYEAIQKRQGEDLPRVIFMTGNAALSADFLRDTREPILEKPFSLSAARGVVKALFREN
jgi:CheY-like chemotaxis protein